MFAADENHVYFRDEAKNIWLTYLKKINFTLAFFGRRKRLYHRYLTGF